MNAAPAGPGTPEHVRAASDPATPAATLADIATRHPHLRLAIARNPATYDELLGWLAEYGDAEVRAAVASRSVGSAVPPAPAPAAPPAPRAPAPARTPFNTAALLAVILGICGGTWGIVFGHIALRQIRRTGERGVALAVVGLIAGYLVTALAIVLFIAALDLDMRLFGRYYY